MPDDRSSEADTPQLLSGREAIAEKEAENTLRQFDHAMVELDKWIANSNYRLRPSTILTLNRFALDGISAYAGVFRPAGVTIKGSGHEPVPAADVAHEVEALCDYIHEFWGRKSAIHLAAYVLWRLNWIHPFVDGNGRIARVVSFLVLCAKVGARIPGRRSIPEQIAANKSPYYKALEDADAHYKVGKTINVLKMEGLIESLLAGQLVSIHEDATGNNVTQGLKGENSIRTDKVSGAQQTVLGDQSGMLGWIERHPAMTTAAAGLIGVILLIIFS